ncbi:MAG: hypothetical protein K2P99_01720 [Burkholderiales bacterium]|nr:hypothetical protein [Burkholderiales bacterium]
MKKDLFDLNLFDTQQQKIINDCATDGLDYSGFAKPQFNAFQMQVAYHALRDGFNLSHYLDDFTCEQLEEIRLAKKSGLDEKQIAIVGLSADEMMMKRINLEYQIQKK